VVRCTARNARGQGYYRAEADDRRAQQCDPTLIRRGSVMSHEHEANKQCGDDRVCAVHASLGGACEWSGGSKVGERMETGKDPCPTRAKTHAAA
jgi:hypothetical protein